MIEAVLLDVGGTLWPNSFGIDGWDRAVEARAVAAALGGPIDEAEQVITLLRQRLERDQAYPGTAPWSTSSRRR